MPRIDVDVTGRFLEPQAGEPASGVVRFELPQPIVSPVDGFTLVPVVVEGVLDRDGRVNVVLSTVSGVNALYRVVISINGAEDRQGEIIVPASGVDVDLVQMTPVPSILTDIPATAYTGPFMTPAANLSDLVSVVAARANLGLGSAATHPASDFATAGSGVVTVNGRSGAVVGVAEAADLIAETNARIAADTTLTAAVNARALDADLDAEVLRALAAESAIVASLVPLATDADVAAETARALAAEGFLQAGINTKADASALAAEASARATADTSLTSAVNGRALASDLTAETSRATAAEGSKASRAANLSDLTNITSARTNLGLGSAATLDSTAFDLAGAAASAQAAAIQRANHTGVQPISSVTGLQAALDAKALASDLTAEATSRASADAVLNTAIVNTNSSLTAETNARIAADALKADLVGGKVPEAQLPSIVISDFLGDVASQAAMLALVGQRGDWTIRTDLGSAFILTGEPSSVLANWKQLPTPADLVSSVNGRTGAVTGLAEQSTLVNEVARATAEEADIRLDFAAADATETAARIAGDALDLKRAANLSDLADAVAARANLGLGDAVVTAATAYVMTSTDGTLLANVAGGGFTVTLPPATAARTVRVQKIDASPNIVTVIPQAGTINGAANDVLANQWQSAVYQSNGTNWFVISDADRLALADTAADLAAESAARALADQILSVTLMRRLRTVNIDDPAYGGINGNDTGNDGPSIQNAMNDWGAHGGRLSCSATDVVCRTTQGLVLPSAASDRVYALDGAGWRIHGVGAIDIVSDTVPTSSNSSRSVRRFIIEALRIYGDGTAGSLATTGQRGLVLQTTSQAELGGVHVEYCDVNFDMIFALNGKLTDCFAKYGNTYDYRLRSGVGVWAGATHSDSASNITSLDNCRSYARAGVLAQYHIYGSGEVLLSNITTEGQNPVDAIVFDRAGNTTTLQFNIKNWHPENAPTNSHLKLLGGPCFVALEAVDWTQGAIMVDASNFGTGEVHLVRCPRFNGKFRHAGPGGAATGVAWVFDGSGSTGTDISNAANWDNGIVPTYRSIRRLSGGADGLGGSYPVIEGAFVGIKAGQLIQLFDRTLTTALGGSLAGLRRFLLTQAVHPDLLSPGDIQEYVDATAKDVRYQLKTHADAATGVAGRIASMPYGGPLGYNLFTRRTTAPNPSDLAAGEMTAWFDQTNASPAVSWMGKSADGTVRTGRVELSGGPGAERYLNLNNLGATPTLNIANGSFQQGTLNTNAAFAAFTAPPVSAGYAWSFTLVLRQDATGSRTATWHSSVKWPNDAAPTLTTTPTRADMLNFVTYDGGTTWYGSLAMANIP